MCIERRRFKFLKQCLPNGKLLLLSVTKCHGVPCSLPSRITTKVLKNCKTFFKTETKTKTKGSRPRPRLHDPRPRLSFLSEAPRDQDPGLEDYITGQDAPINTKSNDVTIFNRVTQLNGCQNHLNLVTAASKLQFFER